jgi:hypothetical protein
VHDQTQPEANFSKKQTKKYELMKTLSSTSLTGFFFIGPSKLTSNPPEFL